MNTVILAAGSPVLGPQDGGYPLALVEVRGVPLIQHLLTACSPVSRHVSVVIRDEDRRKFHLDAAVSQFSTRVSVVSTIHPTGGAACSALLAASEFDDDDDLLVLNCNELIDVNFGQILAEFRARNLDGGVVTFNSIHPRFSFVQLDDAGLVVEASEKHPISNIATAGFYWYRKTKDLANAVQDLVRKKGHVNEIYYLCPAFNQMILRHLRIGTYHIQSSQYHPLKTERQINQFDHPTSHQS